MDVWEGSGWFNPISLVEAELTNIFAEGAAAAALGASLVEKQ